MIRMLESDTSTTKKSEMTPAGAAGTWEHSWLHANHKLKSTARAEKNTWYLSQVMCVQSPPLFRLFFMIAIEKVRRKFNSMYYEGFSMF